MIVERPCLDDLEKDCREHHMQVQILRAPHRTRLCRPYSDHLQQILEVKKGAARLVYAVLNSFC